MLQHRRSVIALALLAAVGTGSAAEVGFAGAASRAALTVAPNPVKLRQAFTVTSTGLAPGETISFQAGPLTIKGFGGGNMGTRRANRAGTIRFRYAPFTATSEVGRWRITAYGAHGSRVASTVVAVLAK